MAYFAALARADVAEDKLLLTPYKVSLVLYPVRRETEGYLKRLHKDSKEC